VFEERIKHALVLFRQGRVRSLILTGGVGEGMRLAESAVARDYLLAAGVPGDRIFIEARSHTTRQNLIEARKLMQQHRLKSALIVSDPFHMKRASVMAKDLSIKAQPSSTPTTRYRSLRSKAGFLLRELYFLHHYWIFGR
jgi:uncharacterized SAM-binding protein YcdF (DUF218 family)